MISLVAVLAGPCMGDPEQAENVLISLVSTIHYKIP